VSAIPPGVRILNLEKVEVFLPIGTLFLQRGRAETGFNPGRGSTLIYARLLHVVEIFIAGDRATAESFLRNRIQKRRFLSFLDPCLNQITHGQKISRQGQLRNAELKTPVARLLFESVILKPERRNHCVFARQHNIDVTIR
jgi:hypothetical protein